MGEGLAERWEGAGADGRATGHRQEDEAGLGGPNEFGMNVEATELPTPGGDGCGEVRAGGEEACACYQQIANSTRRVEHGRCARERGCIRFQRLLRQDRAGKE